MNTDFVVKRRHSLCVEVVGEASPERLFSEELVHHPDDGGALGVRNGVEDLGYFVRVLDRDGDGVGGGQRVQPEHPLQVGNDKLLEKLELRLNSLDPEVFHVAGETLVQPQVGPPGGCHQVACASKQCVEFVLLFAAFE